MAAIVQAFALAALVSPSLASTFYSALSPCPLPCSISGPDPANWTHYHDAQRLSYCDETTLFDLNIHNPVNDPDTSILIRACSAGSATSGSSKRLADRALVARQRLSFNHSDEAGSGAKSLASKCGKAVEKKQAVQLAHWGKAPAGAAEDIAASIAHLSGFLSDSKECGEEVLFARSGKTIVGTYIGSTVSKSSAASLVSKLGEQSRGTGARSAAQLCTSFGPTMFGVVADATGDLAAVQKSLATWSNATCLTGFDSQTTWKDIGVSTIPLADISVAPTGDGRSLEARATCKYTQVKAGDGCWALAKRCGISEKDLSKYNPTPKFCDTLARDQYVCCSAGTLPDFSPKPGADGSCAVYQIKKDDTCAAVAKAHSTDVKRIESVNGNTWGWAGCKRLMVGQKICLSKGDPPMPAEVPNAVCGPQKPGTKKPPKGTKLADLNPCPLNACCNVWGQCGITPEFCTPSPADTHAPGTAKPGSNGCVSHCGTDITNNKTGPAVSRQIAYFEAWNHNRKCLWMSPSNIPEYYTDVHYAFANITNDYNVDVGQYKKMFDEFVALKKKRRIVSFGGWSFSTEADTAPIFRVGVTDAQRQLFANNVVEFAKKYNLDGLDFDWEYPGAPDIPGIPPGDPGDGKRYLDFLKLVRKGLAKDKSVSIAAPASYWYLKGFPIKDIGEVVDYIVYMTYDLHGQWDYGNKFVNEGCPNGNCLRSHVNMTETNYALAMITKAGVPTNKIAVGLARYGRSFEMTKAGCTGPECTFTGPKSGAWPGQCTDTRGYISNWEIRQLIAKADNGESGLKVKQIDSKEGDVVIFNDKQWVSWLNNNNFLERLFKFNNEKWVGTVEWAADLNWNSNGPGNDDPDEGSWDEDDDDAEPACDFSLTFDSLDDLAKTDHSNYCMGIYATATLSKNLDAALADYKDVNNGYDELFGYYVKYIKNLIPVALDDFMAKGGSKYFDCSSGRYDNNKTHTCAEVGKALRDETMFDLYYTLRDDKGFYKDLADGHGIVADWVKFGEVKEESHCTPDSQQDGCEKVRKVYHGYPLKADKVEPPNPKDIVTEAGTNMNELKDKIDATWMDMMLGQWDGPANDAVQVLGIPVAMIKQAIDSMREVKKIGETEKKEEQKNLIITIVSAVLAVVPFVGEGSAALAGMATLGRMIAFAGEIANGALTLYEVVDNPESAPMAMFGMLLGAAPLPRTPASFGKMGKLEAEISGAGTLGKMGEIVAKDTGLIKKIVNKCKK